MATTSTAVTSEGPLANLEKELDDFVKEVKSIKSYIFLTRILVIFVFLYCNKSDEKIKIYLKYDLKSHNKDKVAYQDSLEKAVVL